MPFLPRSEPCTDCLHCRERNLRLFCDLHADALQEFNAMGTLKTLDPGAQLFEEAAPVGDLFVLCHGRVKLTSISRQGKSLVLKIAQPGDVLGLSAALGGGRHEVTAVATEPVQVKSIPRDELLAFLERNAEGGLHAAKSVSAEYQTAFVGARRLALSTSAAGKLAGVLLEWARAVPQPGPEMRFTMALTHEELAGLIGSTRETVTRTLNQFKRDGLIKIRGATIVVLAAASLEEMIA